MHTLRKVIYALALSTIGHSAYAGAISEVADRLLVKSPEAAFQEAIARNDYRLLTVPFCGGNTPGFNFREYRGNEPQENDLGLSCLTLLGVSEVEALSRLESWVEQYNTLMFNVLTNRK